MVDTDYITKESALSCFHDWIDRYGHEHSADEMTEYQRIEELPTADVRPVVRGKWLPTRDDNKKECSKCHVIQLIAQYPAGRADWCPNCGADMREVKTNEK